MGMHVRSGSRDVVPGLLYRPRTCGFVPYYGGCSGERCRVQVLCSQFFACRRKCDTNDFSKERSLNVGSPRGRHTKLASQSMSFRLPSVESNEHMETWRR